MYSRSLKIFIKILITVFALIGWGFAWTFFIKYMSIEDITGIRIIGSLVGAFFIWKWISSAFNKRDIKLSETNSPNNRN
ncbi:MAG: hypothetical protein CMM38_03955 [Rhodospirillaceae bacterium]|nr:hypothetical protein [Rhodospirillaceae bacterium]|tara:strand:- start:69 stop:305 length:237 start_codon:yes stop_codon:yes gene_type:complete